MTMQGCSALTIRGRWPEAAALCLLLWAAPAAAQRASAGGADLAKAVEAAGRGGAQAAERLATLAPRYPLIPDFLAYWRARALMSAGRYEEAAAALGPVWKTRFPSSIAGRAAVLGAAALLEAVRPGDALALLERAPAGSLPEPPASLAAARAQEALGAKAAAAALYQRIWCLYPVSSEAGEAARALSGLAAGGAPALPPLPGGLRMERAQRLSKSGRHSQAREEWLAIARTAATADVRERAEVSAAAALYEQGRTREALAELLALRPSGAETDAMRLHYILLCHRRLDDPAPMMAALDEIRRRAPASDWMLQSLIAAGNYYLVRNEAASFLPLFRACADRFSRASAAPDCHWKVAWRACLGRRAEAESLLKEHLERHPSSSRAGAALYYLGKIEEERGNSAAAQLYFSELQTRFPNYFYSVLASSRQQPAADGGGNAAAAGRFLSSIAWPQRPRTADFQPDEEARWRIARARQLAAASLGAWAEIELRFGARAGAARYALAMEAAGIAARRGAWGASVRHILGIVPGYLWLPRQAAPRRFWELAFPLPYRDAIRREARRLGLDPLLLAALIRQESEFDRDAVSPSGAIGLMQVMPQTGRELGRRLRMRRVTPRALHNPAVNLRIGAYYLARQLKLAGGSVEEALAAYNAGPTRIPVWKEWGEYREPAEFVETIPFRQTRDYVQFILRNREFYRWLYGSEKRAAPARSGVRNRISDRAPAKKPAAKESARGSSARKSPAGTSASKKTSAKAGSAAGAKKRPSKKGANSRAGKR